MFKLKTMLNKFHIKRNEMMIKAVQEQRKKQLSLKKEVQEQFERSRHDRRDDDKPNQSK